MKYKDITKDMVDAARRHLSYDAESGIFTWILPTSQRVEKGSQAGSLNGKVCGVLALQSLQPKVVYACLDVINAIKNSVSTDSNSSTITTITTTTIKAVTKP